jgi:diacylglycerol kinase (ATP)
MALVCNEDAGDGVSRHEMIAIIEERGHRVVEMASPSDNLDRLRSMPGVEAVVAAGGDGTIALVARVLAGSGVPLAVLPMGTANNIASSLGLKGKLQSLVDRWHDATPHPMDLGIATGPWGERRMVESLGGGLVSHGIVVMDRKPSAAGPRESEVARALASYRDVLPHIDAHPWTLRIDGAPLEGAFLLVEVLNTPQIGPNLTLHPRVCASDGVFSVVIAEERHREQLIAYVTGRLEGRTPVLDLPLRTATTVDMLSGDRLHLDDEVFGEPEGPGVSVRMDAAAISVLR